LIPPPELLATAWFPWILNFYWRVAPAVMSFAGTGVTSWFRTPEMNRMAGGASESQHLFGLAMDIVAPPQFKHAVVRALRGAGLVVVEEKRHVHVQLFPAGALARVGVTFPS